MNGKNILLAAAIIGAGMCLIDSNLNINNYLRGWEIMVARIGAVSLWWFTVGWQQRGQNQVDAPATISIMDAFQSY